jgi:hypothetical protein
LGCVFEIKMNARVMRSKNFIASFLLIALTATAFGQISSFRDRVHPGKKQLSPFMTAEYSSRTSQFKAFLSDVFAVGRGDLNPDGTTEPVVLECYITDNVDISYQEEVNVENWMTEPFETGETLELESWMSQPFSWDEALAMESWMSAPFLNSEIVPVERWMTEPFNTGEMIELEEWMATSWQ